MNPANYLQKAVSGVAMIAMLMPYAATASTAYVQDTVLDVGETKLRVMAGSQYESLEVVDGSLKVTVAEGDAVEVRTANGSVILENDHGQPTCNIQRDLRNQMIISGPATATITPSIFLCSASGASTDDTPYVTLLGPEASKIVEVGSTERIFWSVTGRDISHVTFRYSDDSGASYSRVLAEDVATLGYWDWEVPADLHTTGNARIRFEGRDSGRVVAIAVSPVFSIKGVTAEVPPQPEAILEVKQYDYDPATELLEASTISVDKVLPYAAVGTVICAPDIRIKAKGSDTVYYCGRDGKRYVFPNRKTHDTWYNSFAGIVEMELEDLQEIPLGGNVTYRPGARLVKIQTSPEVFAVGRDGTLRYVSEEAAVRLYGEDWSQKVDDIPDAFFTNYEIGIPIE